VRVVLANMTDQPISVSLEIAGAAAATLRRLDDRTVYLAATDPGPFRGSAQPISANDGAVNVDLPPFGLAAVDTRNVAA
jgi:hypothetical protein